MIAISLFPIPIHADTISDSNVHINYYLKTQESYVSGSVTNFRQIYQIDYVFDKEYVGWISSKVVYSMYTDNNLTTAQREFTKSIYVNGGIASITYAITTSATTSGGAIFSMAQSIQNSNVVPYSEIETLEDILSVLQDVYSMSESIEGLSTNQLTELENIVTAVGLSNQYLDTISKFRQWNFPFESYNYVYYMISTYTSKMTEIIPFNQFEYPNFSLTQGDYIYNAYVDANVDMCLIFYSSFNIYGKSTFDQFVSYPSDVTIKSVETLTYDLKDGRFTLNKVVFNKANTGRFQFVLIPSLIYRFMPIYAGKLENNFSLEFALMYGLDNRLLNDIHIIANGTSSSSSSSNDLDDTTSQFQTDANSLISIEDNFNSTMNSNLDNINPTFNMGSSFLASANWVSTQFNRIVNNTPFASLITFGLTLGLGLLIIGKIRK